MSGEFPRVYRRKRRLVSVVIPTCNEGEEVGRTVDSILTRTQYRSYEVIVVDDGSTDGSCVQLEERDARVRVLRAGGLGVARARNTGAAASAGEFLVFIDAHCRVSPNWLDLFREVLADPSVGVAGPAFTRLGKPHPRGCGMVWTDQRLDPAWYEPPPLDGPYDVALTTGACQAFAARNFYLMGEYDEGMTRWGYEDVEMCLRAWLLGYRVVADPRVVVEHHFRESRSYEVSDVGVVHNFLRMVQLHFSEERAAAVLATIPDGPVLREAMESVQRSDVAEVRSQLERARVRDDAWFFRTFPFPAGTS